MRTATSLRRAEIMRIYEEKSSRGALRPYFCDFSAYFPLFGPYSPHIGDKSEKRRAEQAVAAYVAQGAPSAEP